LLTPFTPSSAVVVADMSQAALGLIHIELSNLTDLPDTPLTVLHVQASVPASARYGDAHALDIQGLQLNGGTLDGVDDDGLHLAAYLGDTEGQARYASLDARNVQRVVVRLDNGFDAYPLIDPVIVADVNGNARLDASDARLIQSRVVRMPVPELPELPSLPPGVRNILSDAARATPARPTGGDGFAQASLRATDAASPFGFSPDLERGTTDAGAFAVDPAWQPADGTDMERVLAKARSAKVSAQVPLRALVSTPELFAVPRLAAEGEAGLPAAPSAAIDWTAGGQGAASTRLASIPGGAPWVSDFVGNLGRGDGHFNPNSKLRIALPAVAVTPPPGRYTPPSLAT
jgi:hypothetical protein